MPGITKWFIVCLVIIFLCTSLLIGFFIGFTIHIVDDKMAEQNRVNLLILYEEKE